MSAVYFDERAFADKIMARVSQEPTPSLSGAAATAIRSLDPRLLLGVSWTAWHLATARTAVVRPPLRIKSAALLSVMLLMLAMGTTFAAAGAVAVVEQVTQHFGSSSPNGSHPHSSKPANTNGSKGAAPSAAPAGAQPPVGAGDNGDDPTTAPPTSPDPAPAADPIPAADPGNDGDGRGAHPDPSSRGDQGNKGQGNDGNGSDGNGKHGKSHDPQTSPTPPDSGHGDGHDGDGNNAGQPDGGNDQPGTDDGRPHGKNGNSNGNGYGYGKGSDEPSPGQSHDGGNKDNPR